MRPEQLNDQESHILVGLAQSVSKRVSLIAKRINILNEQDNHNIESMIFFGKYVGRLNVKNR